ncbi:type II toxin-antitoxin system RatA family toxin [Halobacteriovorax sp. HLS]|uniref:type II toxin-antitoxin system RatA family toxin n=1 Tax=Halobacteriovorax sp. HLS TaxID=2234000 RepID=UPI000FD7F4CB|nr:SRPBCC family protein [Halobacteriovorax sp. HLS]
MASVSRTETFDVEIEKLYNVILDYGSYPDFVDGVSTINILEFSEEGARVEYGLNLIKKFKYTLKLTHTRPNKVSWEFESGDLFKRNNGSWELTDLGNGKTEVVYSLDLDVKGFVPKSIISKLTDSSLPAMMKAYQDRARGH